MTAGVVSVIVERPSAASVSDEGLAKMVALSSEVPELFLQEGGGAEYDLTPYHGLSRCRSGADFSNLGCLPAGGPGRQAGRRKNIEWVRPVPKASEQP